MKQKDKKALQDKTVAELHLMRNDLQTEIVNLTLEGKKTKNVHEKRAKKKDIARILTILAGKRTEEHG